jgi:DNA ligase-1
MRTKSVKLYRVDKMGGERVWSIKIYDNKIVIQYGVLGGQLQTQIEKVERGLAGRTHDEQLLSRVKSRINKQLDKGYKKTLEEAHENRGRDASGNLKPMLAQPIKRVPNIDWNSAYVQPKYDGHRMMVEVQDGQARAWSRLGKPITSVPHILEPLSNLPSGTILDGELYHHGTPLQTIASWVKRDQPESANLVYIIFDYVFDAPFIERYNGIHMLLRSRVVDVNHPHITVAETGKVDKREFIGPLLRHNIDQGYEGIIIRHGLKGYEIGARSSSLVKVKQMLDGEFKCVDVSESRDGWAVLTCEDSEGRQFGVSAPGTIDDKREVLYNADKYKGKMLTVEYSQLTKDGKPFHPVAIRWREDV